MDKYNVIRIKSLIAFERKIPYKNITDIRGNEKMVKLNPSSMYDLQLNQCLDCRFTKSKISYKTIYATTYKLHAIHILQLPCIMYIGISIVLV